ncbi:MAG: phage antirepressor N-terminal domain-containing protein [Gordonia sp. (in: high G+C Gram-positive bacteria)]
MDYSGDLVPVEFHGDTIYAVAINDRPHVILKPAFEAIGVDADRQIANIHKQPWATTAVTAVVAGDGKVRNMITADLRSFLMALATIPASRVAEHVRPKLIDYQREVADVIEAHFTGARHHQTIPNTVTWDELSALMRQRYGIDLDVCDITRALRDGGVLKQTNAPRKAHRNWFWFTGSAWTIHPHLLPELTRKVVETRKVLGDAAAIQMELAMDAEIYREVER